MRIRRSTTRLATGRWGVITRDSRAQETRIESGPVVSNYRQVRLVRVARVNGYLGADSGRYVSTICSAC